MRIKHSFLLLVLLAGMQTANAINTKLITITFKYKFINEGDGKDINTRLKIYIDDVVKGVSLAKTEAEQNHVTIEIATGQHKLRAVIESEFEGKWEEHTILNEYSIDCIYLSEMNFTKNLRIELIFDLDKGTIVKNVQTKSSPFNSPF